MKDLNQVKIMKTNFYAHTFRISISANLLYIFRIVCNICNDHAHTYTRRQVGLWKHPCFPFSFYVE